MSHASELIAQDIEEYLRVHENKDMLRFLTCGRVDDGKSTLIGRLLYDSKMIFEDQMAAIEKDSKRFNSTNESFDLALLVDGLQSEREQGITIDVAYRYFSTENRKFIIADTPGHEQYTRNMATGASTCDLAIILVDARHGIQVQTRRHSYICSLLGIKHIVVAVNKMDAVDYEQAVYELIKDDYSEFAENLGIDDLHFVPISALRGDNVVNKSEPMAWYSGSTLMALLNTITIDNHVHSAFRLPVQYVNRPHLDFRGFCGTITSGEINVGDTVAVLPSGKTSRVREIVTFDGNLPSAGAGLSITLTLEDEIDISRGDILVRPHEKPHSAKCFSADLVWMSEQPLQLDREYLIKVGTKSVYGSVPNIEYKVDVNTLAQSETRSLQLNEIGRCHFALNEPVHFDNYKENRLTGAFIMVDRLTNITVGAGMIEAPIEIQNKHLELSEFEKDLNIFVRKHFPHWHAIDVTK